MIIKKRSNIKTKGYKCLEQLISEKERWLFNETFKYSLYKETSTNRCEGIFGILKLSINSKKLLVKDLVLHVNSICESLYSRKRDTPYLPPEIIDQLDTRFKKLNPFCLFVLANQYAIMSDAGDGKKCFSCALRRSHLPSWPCCHYMKKRKELHEKFLVLYDDLPYFAFNSNE